ncbi:MAG: hypothetical protein QOH56_1683, partial [Pseudonocardiales bacterium]|nr:hypothetical protein [Pseudonocardiales bacterium]
MLHAQPGETVAVGAPLISVTARPRGVPDDGFREPGLITPTVSTTEPAVLTGPDAARTGLRSSETSMNSAMRLVERLDQDFAELVVRLLIFSTFRLALFDGLRASADPVLSAPDPAGFALRLQGRSLRH